jgi:hypothetical protein
MVRQGSLIPATHDVEGFLFREGFVTPDEELDLLERIRSLEFHEMKMRGVVARRRVIHYFPVTAWVAEPPRDDASRTDTGDDDMSKVPVYLPLLELYESAPSSTGLAGLRLS